MDILRLFSITSVAFLLYLVCPTSLRLVLRGRSGHKPDLVREQLSGKSRWADTPPPVRRTTDDSPAPGQLSSCQLRTHTVSQFDLALTGEGPLHGQRAPKGSWLQLSASSSSNLHPIFKTYFLACQIPNTWVAS